MRLVYLAAVPGNLDKRRQMVAGAQQQLNQLLVQIQPVGAHFVKHGLEPVGKSHQVIEAKGPGATLDRVHGAEDRVDNLRVVIASFDGGQTLIRCFKELFALLKEGILN